MFWCMELYLNFNKLVCAVLSQTFLEVLNYLQSHRVRAVGVTLCNFRVSHPPSYDGGNRHDCHPRFDNESFGIGKHYILWFFSPDYVLWRFTRRDTNYYVRGEHIPFRNGLIAFPIDWSLVIFCSGSPEGCHFLLLFSV